MLSRARIFATVTLLVSCLGGPAAWAQAQNLEAGKSASQLFAGTCNACHKSPRGLLKTVSPGSLAGFLREHYTTSSDMASQLATYLISNGASDGRQAKQGADKQGADKEKQGGNEPSDRQGRKNRNTSTQEATRPDDAPPPAEGARQGRKRLTRPGEPPDEAKPVANVPAEPATERGPEGRKPLAKQRSKLGKPGVEEPSMANEPAKTEPAKTETGTDDKAKVEPKEEIGHAEPAKPDAESKPSSEAKSEPAKIEAPKDNASGDKPVVRRDSVPAVTPAPSTASTPAPAPAVASGGSSGPAAPQQPEPAAPQPPAVTASAPQPAPAAGGPPAPPISR